MSQPPATPDVSLLIPTYNGAALIGETLESLQRQTLTNWEAVIVDDCSPDHTREVLAGLTDPRFRVLHAEKNGGPVRTRNLALAHARGRHVAGLDQDDLCHPERLSRQVAFLDAHPDVVLVGSAANILENGITRAWAAYPPVTTPLLLEWLLQIENPLAWSTVMVRGEVARSLHPFTRPEILYAEDFDLYHRLSRIGRLARIDLPLLTYRRHGAGASQRFTDTMNASAARVLAEAYAPRFGDNAGMIAGLVARHLLRGQPVADRATLQLLGDTISALLQDFIATRAPDRDSRRLIKWETARRWSRISRAALRSGALSFADTVAVRPAHLGLGYAGPEELLASGLIGGVRGARRRRAG
ncbi:glycosyltransferase family 2 protein [Sphingomonas aracearum]|uniref:Glycosyltransferase family 2 protein n=1 Tax=Sphingomonas aracearum TaxID=2283317 RepID=A0A369VSP6_9SPHN|nr:glycosyltransferase family A protein [Sphingomonas aracearum]RDE04889.1 glycosyltransferase family 2 protein [Sphingomonas aracearum]